MIHDSRAIPAPGQLTLQAIASTCRELATAATRAELSGAPVDADDLDDLRAYAADVRLAIALLDPRRAVRPAGGPDARLRLVKS